MEIVKSVLKPILFSATTLKCYNQLSLYIKQTTFKTVPCSGIIGKGVLPRQFSLYNKDCLILQVGDIVSVIDMHAAEDTMWWRGKRGFEVNILFTAITVSQCIHIFRSNLLPEYISNIEKLALFNLSYWRLSSFVKPFKKCHNSSLFIQMKCLLKHHLT